MAAEVATASARTTAYNDNASDSDDDNYNDNDNDNDNDNKNKDKDNNDDNDFNISPCLARYERLRGASVAVNARTGEAYPVLPDWPLCRASAGAFNTW